MITFRLPCAALRPFVSTLWAQSCGNGSGEVAEAAEAVLPTDATHLVLRLGDAPLRVMDGSLRVRAEIHGGVVGGARAAAYLRREGEAGSMLRPGAARALFGVPADALSRANTWR